MKQRIVKLSVLQTGKLLAALYGFIALVMLPFMFIIMLANPEEGAGPMVGMLVMLLLYPLMGFVGGILMAALYNLASKWVGGLEMSVEAVEGE